MLFLCNMDPKPGEVKEKLLLAMDQILISLNVVLVLLLVKNSLHKRLRVTFIVKFQYYCKHLKFYSGIWSQAFVILFTRKCVYSGWVKRKRFCNPQNARNLPDIIKNLASVWNTWPCSFFIRFPYGWPSKSVHNTERISMHEILHFYSWTYIILNYNNLKY